VFFSAKFLPAPQQRALQGVGVNYSINLQQLHHYLHSLASSLYSVMLLNGVQPQIKKRSIGSFAISCASGQYKNGFKRVANRLLYKVLFLLMIKVIGF
jgi:hypothetical protein